MTGPGATGAKGHVHEGQGGEAEALASAPNVVAVLACRLASHALPADVRDRYAQEWWADLTQDPSGGMSYAMSVLLNVVALRAAVTSGRAPRSVLCRLRLHHYVVVHDNPENHRFATHVCRRCGYINDDLGGSNSVDDSMAWGTAMGIH